MRWLLAKCISWTTPNEDRSARFRAFSPPRGPALALALATAVVLSWPANRPASAGHGPWMDNESWIDDLTSDADELAKNFEEAVLLLSNARLASLTPEQRAQLAQSLAGSVGIINRVLNPSQYPSLDPSATGQVDESVDPAALADYADACADLAFDAYLEVSNGEGFDQDAFASALLTIEHLITRSEPHNYRSVAGIQ
ncbi:MAG: hypothetical protein ACYTJ0_10005 [Planctomycetota bacterium]|jgi:hypothetical protein